MYAPSSLTSCCTAILHALLQNPAALVVVGILGVGFTIADTEKSDPSGQCPVSVKAPDFAKDSHEAYLLQELTRKALSAFERVPTGTPSKRLVSDVLEKLRSVSGRSCWNADQVLGNQTLLRELMTVYFLDLVSAARSVDEAVAAYKRNTAQEVSR